MPEEVVRKVSELSVQELKLLIGEVVEEKLKVCLSVLDSSKRTSPTRRRAKKSSIAEYAFCGMWKDREEMADSSKWVEEQRARWADRLTR